MYSADLLISLREVVAMLLELEPEQIPSDQPLSELGIDSLMRVEIIALVEQSSGLKVPDEHLPELRTIDDIARYVDAIR